VRLLVPHPQSKSAPAKLTGALLLVCFSRVLPYVAASAGDGAKAEQACGKQQVRGRLGNDVHIAREPIQRSMRQIPATTDTGCRETH